METKNKDFVSKVSEEELKNLAGGNDEITPQSTVVCVSLRICKWSTVQVLRENAGCKVLNILSYHCQYRELEITLYLVSEFF